MKTSTFRLLNFFAINLLLLALYLNFVHKDNNTAPVIPVKNTTEQRAGSKQRNDQLTRATTPLDKQRAVLN